MNVNNLKVGDILFCPDKGIVQIKEITYLKCNKKCAQYFVTSGDCVSISDAQTTIIRQVMYWSGDLQNYFYLDPIESTQ